MQETWLAKIGKISSQNELNQEFMREIGSRPVAVSGILRFLVATP